jgi:hypothetical protein
MEISTGESSEKTKPIQSQFINVHRSTFSGQCQDEEEKFFKKGDLPGMKYRMDKAKRQFLKKCLLRRPKQV